MSNVRMFGAKGDGITDDTAAIVHALEAGDGVLEFPPGAYLLSRTIRVELAARGPVGLVGSAGTARLIMAASGPALHLAGTHAGTAHPPDVAAGIWQRERLPTVLNLEIVGRHPQASGILCEGTMQVTLAGVLLRELEHGIHLRGRARNLLVSHCHVYHLRGVGIYLDAVNLHQAIVTGSHISYCLGGGIKVAASEIRNLQITGNDIEYNHNEAAATADVWIDCTAPGSSVREGTISGNTIQANYSPGGANVRLQGRGVAENHRAGLFAITGNLIGSQEVNVHLASCRGVTATGNVLYSARQGNVVIEDSRNVVFSGNTIDHNPDYRERELCTGVRVIGSTECALNGNVVQDCLAGEHTVAGPPLRRQGLLQIERSRRVLVAGCQLVDGTPYGIYVEESSQVSITGNQVLESRQAPAMRAAVRWIGPGHDNLLALNTLAHGSEAEVVLDDTAGVTRR
jgi:hypothetical protein